jgi:ribonuclease HI
VALEAWFDGACEPVNPGGIGTWAYVVHRDGATVASGSGTVGDPREPTTSNVAEYWGLRHLLQRLLDEGWHREPVTIHGDSRLIILQVTGAWRAHRPHLAALRDSCQAALRGFAEVRFVQVPRERNAEADELTHRAYEAALDADPGLRERFAGAWATPAQVEACRRRGLTHYRYMGKGEVARLLMRSRET